MKKFEKDFTKGKLGSQIIRFSVPLMLSNLLQVFFNMADIAVVGQFAGPVSLGAVGSTTILVAMFTTALIGVTGGVNVLVAHAVGARNKRNIKETVHTSALVCAAIGILLMLAGVIFAGPILTVLKTKEEFIYKATIYLSIYFMGMPALALYNFGNAVLSAVGDTKRPLAYLSAAGVINIVLNILFVVVFKLDVAGVAIASIISQYISAILVIRALFKSGEDYALKWRDFRISKDKLKAIVAIGIPSGIQNGIFQLANLFVQVSVNSFSATFVAGNSAAANSDALIYDVMAAFYSACACFIGQNYGAGNRERIKKSYFICLAYSFGTGAIMGLLLILFGRQFLAIFTSDPAVIDAGMQRIVIMGFSYAVSAFMDCTIAASRGLGKSFVPTVIVTLGSCVFRVIWIYTVFAYFGTITSLYLLYVFSWSITAAAELVYFVKIYKKVLNSNQFRLHENEAKLR